MRFVTVEEVKGFFAGKSVALVGSAPSCLDNPPGFVDSHEIVVRVNNYKTGEAQGRRCDVHYSFYGTSIRKAREGLIADGVKLCLCKCPNSKPIESAWHERNGKAFGIDYRYIYQDEHARRFQVKSRASWWFCETFVPEDARYREKLAMLEGHIPTTGFAAIVDVLSFGAKSVYLTGFDFFASGVHNVDERWKPGHPDDPMCHDPAREARALVQLARKHVIGVDRTLARILADARLAPTGPCKPASKSSQSAA